MDIALKVFMVLPNIMCQKPSKFSKNSDHQKLLGERLQMWNEGKIENLFRDGELIQRKLVSSRKVLGLMKIFQDYLFAL